MNIQKQLNKLKIILKKIILNLKLDSEILMSKAIKKDKKFIILNLIKKLKKKILYFKKFN
jgi:hypothetical protein